MTGCRPIYGTAPPVEYRPGWKGPPPTGPYPPLFWSCPPGVSAPYPPGVAPPEGLGQVEPSSAVVYDEIPWQSIMLPYVSASVGGAVVGGLAAWSWQGALTGAVALPALGSFAWLLSTLTAQQNYHPKYPVTFGLLTLGLGGLAGWLAWRNRGA